MSTLLCLPSAVQCHSYTSANPIELFQSPMGFIQSKWLLTQAKLNTQKLII